MAASDGIGWGAKKAENKGASIDSQFNRKYKVKLNQIKLAEKRLNSMMKNGGGQILSLEKYDKQVKQKLEELAAKCTTQKYEQNLDAKLEFINFKIGLLTSDSAKTDLEASQKEASDKQKQELEKVQEFIEKLVEAYNNAGSNVEGDNTKVKEQAFEDKKKDLEKDIETSDKYIEYNYDSEEAIIAEETGEGSAPIDEQKTKKNREDAKKHLETAYKQAKEGIKAAENLAEQNAKKALAMCKKSIKLPDEEKAREASKEIEKALQKTAAELAKLPDDIVKQFKQIESFLQSLITGFGDMNFMLEDGMVDLEAKLDSMIASLQSLLDPVFNTATSLSLPLPPIVAPIKDLLAMIPQMGKDPPGLTPDQKALIEKFKKQKIQIPQDWKESLNKMKDSLFTVMTTFPLCLIQLIFNMIDALIGQILALGGAMPYPLNLIPLAIQLMPKLLMLQQQLPQVMYQIIEKKIKDMVAQAMALGASVGSSVNGIVAPTPQCPEAVKAELQKKMEAQKKAAEEQRQLKIAQMKQAKEDALKKQLEAKAAADEAYRNSPEYKKAQEAIKKQAEMLAEIEKSKPKTVEEKEDQENQKLCNQIIKEAQTIKTNNSSDQPKDIANTPDSELSEDEKKQKEAEKFTKGGAGGIAAMAVAGAAIGQ